MTHEQTPRTTGEPAGPEQDDSLPDADSIPVYSSAAEALAAGEG